MTTTLNFPCICAIVNSLSNLSFSAVRIILGMWMLRKIWLSPLNQLIQCFSVSCSLTFHPYTFCPFLSISTSCGGIETLADSIFLKVQLVYPHLIADCRESKCLGLSAIIWFMKGRASIAVPSTTSITIHPTILSFFSTLVRISTIRHAIEPPKEWPTTTTFLSGNFWSSCFKT